MTPIKQASSDKAIKFWSLASVVSLFGLIVLGGIVRVTESGLGCPDWPFCHGKAIPSTDPSTIIEYTHRVFAAFTGLILLITAGLVWRKYRPHHLLLRPMIFAVLLLVIQIILGGLTVITELEEFLVMAHLTAAEILLALMLMIAVVAWVGLQPKPLSNPVIHSTKGVSLYIMAAPVMTFAIIISGAYVQASGATGACGESWPLCLGELFPGGKLAGIHMLHRVISLIGGLVIFAALLSAWNMRQKIQGIKITAILIASIFLSQMLIGGINIHLAFHQATNILHLALATLIWGLLVILATLSYLKPGPLTGGQYSD